ncbi:hypothetical protein CA54_37520 [Symmachiella macrocystis]|uniref:Cytochrome C n=1 Tax=Symmachiella macrocystis TaxID=2527985 RepID=A0A5C6BSY6_9PLAN|nr:hypothetical protein [Symmachiella macrocystis]TWU14882.1 hypothetical protein CA54_37520 [Symmachiella macrocystis]
MTDYFRRLNTPRLLTVALTLSAVFGTAWVLSSQPDQVSHAAEPAVQKDAGKKAAKPNIRKMTPVQVFMRAKLEDNTKILEGLMTNQFDQIVEAADHLLLMSTATEWHVIQGPIYKQHSTEFRRAVERLKIDAQKKNLDAATLAYMHMTMTCVSCHKFVRGTQLAGKVEMPPHSLVSMTSNQTQSP